MAEQYFTAKPQNQEHKQIIGSQVKAQTYEFETDNGVFSKNRMDYGSKVLVEAFVEAHATLGESRLLELGSGYGPVAIILAATYPDLAVTGIEVNERAVVLAKQNALRNHVSNVEWVMGDATKWQGSEPYQYVLTNPPIRAGKSIIQQFVRNAHRQLTTAGELWVVIQKKQGAPSMETFMETVFGNVELVTRDKGYWILKSVKTAE